MKQTTIDNPIKRRDPLTIALVSFSGLILAAFIIFPVIDSANAETSPYEPLTPQAQVAYDQAKLAFCETEKTLAGAKLIDIVNEVEIEGDLNDLKEKRDMDCTAF